MRALVVAALVLAACTDQHYLVVTVDARPAVHGATALAVVATNAGGNGGQTLELGMHAFPATFSIATPNRTGQLAIAVQACAGDCVQVPGEPPPNLVGTGATSATIGDKTAAVLLDSADFVVNTVSAGDHFLSDDFEANGFQIGATTDGTWTVGFRDDCATSQCNLFARRFDKTGQPVSSTLAAGTDQFAVTTTTTTSIAEPAITVAGQTTLVLWDFADTGDALTGVACRALDGNGNAMANQLGITTDSAQVVSAATLSNGNVAVTWSAFISPNPEQIRAEIIHPDCTPLTGPSTASANSGTTSASRPNVAASANTVLFAWVQDAFSAGDIHVRAASNLGVFTTNDLAFVLHTTSQEVDHVRIAPFGGGFAIVGRWGAISGSGPGSIVLYRATVAGATVTMVGTPTLITDQSGSDFSSDKSFGIGVRSDGALLVVWHVCANPDGSNCNVYGRLVRPTGVPVGDPFIVPTATGGFQTNPAAAALPDSFAVAWHDTSTQVAGKLGEVRARIIYPPYDDAQGVLGATCGAANLATCGMGLLCGGGSDSMMRCYTTCNPAGSPPLCPGGGTCSPVTGGNACTF